MPGLAISSGDPAGIGPEVCAKACRHMAHRQPTLELHLFGDARGFPADVLALPQVHLHDRRWRHRPVPGVPSADNAPYTIGLIADAAAHVQAGKAQALVTAPIAKAVLYDAGFAYPGHTEYLGHLAGEVPTFMMIASPLLRVVPVTLHQSLRSAIDSLTTSKIIAAACATHTGLQTYFGIAAPRLSICGLNPHAGERGTMGEEDEVIVRPAVSQLRNEGIHIRGPLPADTLFHAAARATYDCALGLYHDQVLIPAKALAFDTGVNVTLGLPFVRTSPDHGTAFDLAGQDRANPASMIAALELAADLSQRSSSTTLSPTHSATQAARPLGR